MKARENSGLSRHGDGSFGLRRNKVQRVLQPFSASLINRKSAEQPENGRIDREAQQILVKISGEKAAPEIAALPEEDRDRMTFTFSCGVEVKV